MSDSPHKDIDKKGILRGALALAQVTELEALVLIHELFEEAKDKS